LFEVVQRTGKFCGRSCTMTSASKRVSCISRHVLASPVSSAIGGRYAGQVCVITGGARGIGRTVAERFASEGAKAIVLFDVGDGSEAVAALQKIGAEAVSVNVDITNQAAVEAAVAGVLKQFGRVDVLVQSAGTTGATNLKTHEVDPANFQMVFDVNVKAMFLVARSIIPSMLETGYGRIVNVASIAGKDGNAGMLAYSASKAAVIGLTKVMGKDYCGMGKDITVNCVAPAVVRTAMVAAMPDEQVKYMLAKIPMGRTGGLDEVGATIAFAASKECSFTTGFCFDCTGGRAVF